MTALPLPPAPNVPAMPGGNTAWAAGYGAVLKDVFERQYSRQPRNVQVHLGPSELGEVCLAGETEVVTRQGIRKIRDLAKEGSAELLVPLRYQGEYVRSEVRKRWGKFRRVPVEYFGEQELFEITLRRNQDTKIVHATAEHHWYRSFYSGKIKTQTRLETRDLKPGYRLTQLRQARPKTTTLMPVAVAQGFIFGDGTVGSSDDRHRPASLHLYHNGKDEALLPYFPGEHKVYSKAGHAHKYSVIRGLPRFWKHLPPADESVSFLMSWLAGYFAADGSVTEDGHCKIDSAYRENLEFVRNAAAICGIGYGQIQTHMRRAEFPRQGAVYESPLYRLSLRRWDLPDWFFLIPKHAQRAKAASLAPEHDPHWIVESVKATGRKESVYCAITGDAGAFALADDLMTGNCDRQIVGKLAGLPRTNHVTSQWPAAVGTAVHALLAQFFSNENLINGYTRWAPEVRVYPDPSYPGSADLYDGLEEAVVDHKVLGSTQIDKLRRQGPSVRYFTQLLLYAKGYQLMGYPVRRIVLAAWPRTAPTLAQMYIWEHVITPDDDITVNQVLSLTAWRAEIARHVMAGDIRIEDVPMTATSENCKWCFAAETPIVTRDGIKPISELAGTSPELLVPRITGQHHALQTRGGFVQAPVRAFGEQQLWKITLGSNRAEKIIYATAEHRWILTAPVAKGPGTGHVGQRIYENSRPERITSELQPGDRLRSLRATLPGAGGAQLMPWAVAQGFTYGDGHLEGGNRPAGLVIYDNDKDEALLPFFPFTEPNPGTHTDSRSGKVTAIKRIYGLPRFWKDLPPIRESRTFLLSWLAGYFAADGCVSEDGQPTLNSADEQAILFARDVAAVCGVGYRPPRSRLRLGYGRKPTLLWSLNLRRQDLPEWFFLIKEHAVRATAASDRKIYGTYWTVKSVEPTSRVEPVYCATIPGTGMFGLADDLLTGNCPYFRPETGREIREGRPPGPGCPGNSPLQ